MNRSEASEQEERCSMSFTEQDVERAAPRVWAEDYFFCHGVYPDEADPPVRWEDIPEAFRVHARALSRAALEAVERETLDWKDRKHLIEVQGQLMRDWSEAYWAAGWMSGLEELVWDASDPDAEAIKRHARLTGVWITDWYDDEGGDPIPTMPLEQWEEEEWPRRQKANRIAAAAFRLAIANAKGDE